MVGTVFLATAPAGVVLYFADEYFAKHIEHYGPHQSWAVFIVGALALGAAWFGGERFILRQVRLLSGATQKLAGGDLSSRTGLSEERGELGELARAFDSMASTLEQRVKEREQAERTLLNRAFQQTVVGALGQFGMISNDINALLEQAVMLAGQTLEVEFCQVLELQPGDKFVLLRAGSGWKEGYVGRVLLPVDGGTEVDYALRTGEAVYFEELAAETRFSGSSLLVEHGVVSGIGVRIAGHGHAFGVLGAYTARRRKFTEDEIHFLFSLATVLAMAVERIRTESELLKLAAFVQLNPNPAMELTGEGAITYCNEAAAKLAESVGQEHPRSLLPANIREITRHCLASGQSIATFQTEFQERTLAWSLHPVLGSQVVHGYVADRTDKLKLEAQLLQSQKMESIGQLAAGVAHDFNNMLTVIQGHSGMILAKPNLPPLVEESANAVYFAAERAAGLTRQLLMFSRKNVMKPRLLDLREVVSNLLKMLKRILGEPVALEFHSAPEIPLVQADTGMMEQIIMNLAVNARDAMPKGGRLSIGVSAVEIAEDYVQTRPDARVGRFVCLEVRDSGCGMDAATRAHIFEPFFTTKEVGKGTGLGLATVYGIVKQHEGWVEVTSEVGQGTTFKVYLPASTEPVQAVPAEAAPAAETKGGNETILVVEDEAVLRDMAHVILQDCGYNVLDAGSAAEALQVWDEQRGAIDLVLTDVVMPGGMSGRDLATKLLARNAKAKIIFTSGYYIEESQTDAFHKGGVTFLQKPYTRPILTKAVRECLDKPPG